ncbi:hypothetical protein VHUM_03120 [Vanrija humicola]|uniref:Uncharacterized protein n=1 Tax=Vanrija humicola TaxID=5417 RepID=A0A7D8YXS0_VANHU|nr:hypothetical protein VHUM_03120 [Vanrija humicola]
MSISLPNGTMLAAPSSSQPQVSAAVTRILHLANFSPEIKTRDIQTIFKEWESDKGGFRIKWLDDVNAMVVFADANVAKRAYLNLLLNPPPTLPAPATIRPYDRPDAAQIIQSLAARAMGHRASMSSALTSGNFANLVRDDSGRSASMSGPSGLNGFKMPLNPSFSFGGSAGGGGNGRGAGSSHGSRLGSLSHQRTGSASSSWTRQSMNGALSFGGAVNPPSLGAARLPTHSEGSSAGPPSRATSSSSSHNDPIVVLDSSAQLKSTNASLGGRSNVNKSRRESVSAEKALREVEKALQSVEAQG